jgi:mRNA-degrading endonuclease RelE of RelBE toxin-antitoxin system
MALPEEVKAVVALLKAPPGYQPQYRLRIGDTRVFYDVTETAVEVLAVVSKAQAETWLKQKGAPRLRGWPWPR